MNHILIATAITLSAVIFLGGCDASDTKAKPDDKPKNEQVVSVRVQEIKLIPFAEVLPVTGIVKAYDDVLLSPEEGGTIKEWKVKKGASVAKGQVIAALNDDVLQASFDAAYAQYQLAALNYSKQERIYAEQAISEMQLKTAQYNRDAAKAQADLTHARLERTKLRSPVNGILNDRFADEGEYVSPGVPVAHIVNVNTVRILAEVPEKYSTAVSIGAPVRLTVEAAGGDTLSGKVNFVGAAVSPNNRTLPVEILLPNSNHRLKPEMVARVQIVREKRSGVILVDDDIVQQVDRHKMVVYVENNGRAEERVVKIGAREGHLVEIVNGLKPGDRVIVSGIKKLVDGQLVEASG